MIIRDTPENEERLIKEFKDEQGVDNIMKRKLREMIQSNDQTKINKYAEGFCYGCARTDQILSSLFLVCKDCIRRKGPEGLYTVVATIRRQELCDFCGFWKFNILQINCGLCRLCMKRVIKIHKDYRKGGGQLKQNPFYKMLRRKHGQDWLLQLKGGRRLNL